MSIISASPFRACTGLILLLTGSLHHSVVTALPFVVNDDVVGVWNNRFVVAAAYRAKDPDKQLVGSNNAPEYPGARGAVSSSDDGNLNYRKGDLISAPVIYTTDLELRYKNRYGIYAKARSWYDYAGNHRDVPHGSVANAYVPDSKLDDSDYHKYNKFSGYRVADLYVYGNWDVGASRLTGRLGQQSINWGESLLYTGINAFNPINFSALGRPGVRQDDALVPVNRIYTNLITRNGVSLEAFYALNWEESHISACGTLTGIADNLTDPGCNLGTVAVSLTDREQLNFAPLPENPLVVPRTSSRKPGSGGQYGLSTRYFVEALDTEFGLYYINYHATTPVLDLTLCDNGWDGCTSQDGLTVPMRYQEDVKAFAISAATGVRNIALSAELSQFRDLPVQRNFPELIEGATQNRGIYADRMTAAGAGALFDGGWKADRTQLLLGGRLDLSSTLGLADASMAVEASGQWITNLPGTGQERIGRNGNWGAAAAPDGICQPLTQDTQAGCETDGFVTDFSWGYRMFSVISLPRPARGIDLQTLVSWNHDVDGYALDGSQIEGRRIVGLRLQALFQRTWFLEIGRTWVHSTTDYDIARDKDVYSIAAGVAF
jgi:hypothetical protein